MSDTPPADSPKRFRVAFSFAGEKRPFVAELAAILAKRFGKKTILYDHYHKPEFARDDLVAHLTKLYRDCSDLIVVVFCPDYETKPWCGLEWKTIRGLLKKGKRDEIMLTRYKLVEPDALEGLAGYIDLDHENPESVAAFILERLALNEGNEALSSPAVALPTSSFPSTPPEISWLLADGLEVRRAVEGVLCAESERRIVLVRGESGRGKTETCRILWEQGMQFEWLRCGRLDLKGASELDRPVHDFIAQLRAEELLPASPSGGALDRISGLIAALDRAPQPTLLVFDNFDLGGEFSRWVEGVLPAVKQHEWLRVVVAGQKVPAFAAAAWGGPKFRPVVLECIPVVDWVEFGQRFKKDLPAQEVEAVYKASKGDHQLMRMLVENLCGIGS